MQLLKLYYLSVSFQVEMPQAPYSPDIAPYAFIVLLKLKKTLKEHRSGAGVSSKASTLKEPILIATIGVGKIFQYECPC